MHGVLICNLTKTTTSNMNNAPPLKLKQSKEGISGDTPKELLGFIRDPNRPHISPKFFPNLHV
jgi:hypothetical protein